MTIKEIYDLAIEMGIKSDPRTKSGVMKALSRRKKDYDDLSLKNKKYFDEESLINPYSDTRILVGDPKKEIKKVLAGIDSDSAEPLLVDRLNQKGEGIGLLISHHPSGHALASLHEVMDAQVDMFVESGVPKNIAYSMIQERKGYVKRRFSPINHTQAVDAARLLDIPFMVIHTVWDNLGYNFMNNYLQKNSLDTLSELFDKIMELPEFIESTKGKAGPAIVSGTPNSPVGKIAVHFTGGTNPSKELYMESAKAGVGTIIDMHILEDALVEMKKMHVNVIDTGHMASDSIGANLFLDALEKQGVATMACSGLIRVRRKISS